MLDFDSIMMSMMIIMILIESGVGCGDDVSLLNLQVFCEIVHKNG